MFGSTARSSGTGDEARKVLERDVWVGRNAESLKERRVPREAGQCGGREDVPDEGESLELTQVRQEGVGSGGGVRLRG